jgi:hypothetical protein
MTSELGFPHPGPPPKGAGGKRRVMITKRERGFLFADAGCVLQEWLIINDASIACISWSGNRTNAVAAGEEGYGRESEKDFLLRGTSLRCIEQCLVSLWHFRHINLFIKSEMSLFSPSLTGRKMRRTLLSLLPIQ